MNIALIVHELLAEGGGERQCVSLARALMRQGHSVTLYTSAYNRDGCFPEVCRNLIVREVGRGLFPWLRKPLLVRGYLDMLRLGRKVSERYDVWNPQHWPSHWGAVRLKKKLGGVVVWMSNDVPNLHEKAQEQHPIRNFFRAIVYRLFYLYDRKQIRKVDLTALVSSWAENEFRQYYPGKTCIARPGIDPEQFRPGGDRAKIRQRFGYSQDDFVIFWLGILMPHRRLQDAIAALAELKQRRRKVKLLIGGSEEAFPDYARSLKTQVASLGLREHVQFAGKVPDGEIRDFYCACDAFLFPNEHQTWGLAVLEAMACGSPVVVSRGAAISEALQHGETGMLFAARNPAALADEIETLIHDPILRSKIAGNGMQLARSTYSWEHYSRRVAELFRRSIGLEPLELKLPEGLTTPQER